MEVYREQTREVIERFLDGKLSFPDCIAALNDALANLIPRLTPEQIVPLRALMFANHDVLMQEMERRAQPGNLLISRNRPKGKRRRPLTPWRRPKRSSPR